MHKTLREQLIEYIKLHPHLAPRRKRKNKRKLHKIELTSREIKELMGTNKQTYRRGKGGAWRAKQ